MSVTVSIAAAVLSLAVFLQVFYPRRYEWEIAEASREFGVEEELVYAVIRTESRFRPRVQSGAGAQGLMQLMPSTAAWIAESIGESGLAADLFDSSANIRLGTAYLRYLTDKYPLSDALAAYNAGEGNLLRWRKEGREEYGFKETRAYVKKVLSARKVYRMLV